MPLEHGDGAWPYRGFTVRYHRRADAEAPTPDVRWWAEIPDAPTLPPIIGATYALIQHAAEQAIDDLLPQGRLAPPARSPHYRDYRRLADHLATLPGTVQESVLSFAALEELLGGPLPPTAQTTGAYWSDVQETRVRRWERSAGRPALMSGGTPSSF